MTGTDLPAIASRLIETGSIEPADVLLVRRAAYGDGAVSLTEAGLLIEIETARRSAPPEWAAFLVEALADLLVNQIEPTGYVTAAQADFLTANATRSGAFTTPLLLEAAVHILERARSTPRNLVLTVLETIRAAVVSRGGSITSVETALARRAVFAGGGAEGLAVSREEAELLFDIDGALGENAGDEHWPDFFARAVGNHLLSVSIHAVPEASVALRRQRWLDQPTDDGLGSFLGRMLGSIASPIRTARREMLSAEAGFALDNAADEAALSAAAELTPAEVAWVIEKLAGDSRLSAGEEKLKAFLLEDRTALPPSLDRVFAALAA